VWRGPVTLAVITGVALAVMPALAAQGPTITASDTVFTPAELTVAPGEAVKLANAGGTHNFRFPDGDYPMFPTPSNDPVWDDLSRTFAQPGEYPFVCGAHPQMTGVVRVQDPAATATPTPTPTPTPEPSESAPPEVRTLRVAGASFCMRRGPRCPKPGVRVRIDLSQPATVAGTLRRRGRRFGNVRFGTVAAGARTLRFRRTTAGRRLVSGRYTLRLRIAGDAQPALRFRVR
jgi:plastocyanin